MMTSSFIHCRFSRLLFCLSAILMAFGQLWAQAQAESPSATSLPPSGTETFFHEQTKKLNFYTGLDMGLGLGFRASSLSYADATAIIDANIAPKLGFFPLKRLLVGGTFDLFGSIASFDAQNSYSLYSQTWGGFLRYYLKGGFFGEVQYGRGKGIEERKQPLSISSRQFQTERYSIGLGIGNFWTKHFNFELLLKYNSAFGHFDDTRDLYLSGLSVNAGIGFSVGR